MPSVRSVKNKWKDGTGEMKIAILAVMILLSSVTAYVYLPKATVIEREIKVHLLNIPGMSKSWVNDANDVKSGVQKAVDDANDDTKHRVKRRGEVVTFDEITNLDDMEKLLMNSEKDDIFLSAGGQSWPYPTGSYTVNVRFFGHLGDGDVDYNFRFAQTTWLGHYIFPVVVNPTASSQTISSNLNMTIHW
jgi:hypothetical protein